MKQIIKTMREISVVISLVLMVVLTGCNQTTSNKDDAKEKSVSKVKEPKMDIHAAVVMNNVVMIKEHIAYGSDLNVKEPMGGSTPLISASFFGHADVVKALIDGGADVNALNNEESTALHTAAFFCYQDIVKLLLDAGIDQSVRNIHGSTALESVQAPFEYVKGIYEQVNKNLKPMGVNFDLNDVETQRPIIAKMLSK